jgi:hypothetical protein
VDNYAMMAASEEYAQDKFILDSGATNHMVGNSYLLDNYELIQEEKIIIADNTIIKAVGKGRLCTTFKARRSQ